MSLSPAARALTLGVDIGGTFTDLVLADPISGRTVIGKVLTTPEDPARGVLEGVELLLAEAQVGGERVAHTIHATTLITNAIIERKGYQERKGYRQMLSRVGGGRTFEVRPEEGETLRRIKGNVRRSANELGLQDIQSAETVDGTVLVWSEERPACQRRRRNDVPA